MSKPSLPSGTRDFGPDTVRKRSFIFNTIKAVFEIYGFQPLETPAMENLDTLMGKYGEEGDKLIFKILNNGLNDPKNQEKAKAAFDKVISGKNDKNLTERALRYDLTIPFARYVAMNHGQLALPFRRYQIQPVWRADRPQKGRYREFYQCDADVVGSRSLLNEVELAAIYKEAFQRLGIPVEIRFNNRKILAALAEHCGGADKMMDITIAIDKLDKIGMEQVKAELMERGLTTEQVNSIEAYLKIEGSNEDKLAAVEQLLGHLDIAQKGIAELRYVLEMYNISGINHSSVAAGSEVQLVCDFTLARGLNYYTGIIFEVRAVGVKMGSIGGGGRYDDLTGLFGVSDIPGVGISFGVDRIYDVMEELELFPDTLAVGTEYIFFNLGEAESRRAFILMQELRSLGKRCELYPEAVKLPRQFKYADQKKIPFAIFIGTDELAKGTLTVKNLLTGEQREVEGVREI